jgi:hypothetical protein
MWTWVLIAILVAAGLVFLTSNRSKNKANDPESTQDTAQSAEENGDEYADSEYRASSAVLRPLPDAETGQSEFSPHAAFGSDPGPAGQPYVQLLEHQEQERVLGQWRDIQAEFVDEPRQAVKDGDALVAELMQRLAQTFATEREQLESQWAGGDDVSTEDLRQSLRRYRSFFDRLLAA